MPRLQPPAPGRLICSIAYAQIDALADCLKKLEQQFGEVQFETLDIPFTSEPRHREEMGHDLTRRFFSFDKMVPRDRLPDLKRICRKIEAGFADQVDDYLFRTVNVDPGIMTPENVIMASGQGHHYHVYLTNGVFAQIELIWSRGRFVQLPWTNPDFTHTEAVDFFRRVRETFDLIKEEAFG